MLLSANHEARNVFIGNQPIPVPRGTFITSEVKLSERWGWSRKKVRGFLAGLELDKMLAKKSTSMYTAITIENYDLYQDTGTAMEQQKNSEGTAKEQRRNTNKNIRNKEDKKYIFVPPSLEEVTEYCRERKNGIDPQKFIDYYTANGWMRGKTKIKDWRACIRTWEGNNKVKPLQQPQSRPQNAANFKERQYGNDFYEKLKKVGMK